MLSPNKKDLIFKGPNLDAPYGESRLEDQYWQSLEAEFEIYENSQTSQVRGRNFAVIRDLNNLDLLLSTNNATPLALDDCQGRSPMILSMWWNSVSLSTILYDNLTKRTRGGKQ